MTSIKSYYSYYHYYCLHYVIIVVALYKKHPGSLFLTCPLFVNNECDHSDGSNNNHSNNNSDDQGEGISCGSQNKQKVRTKSFQSDNNHVQELRLWSLHICLTNVCFHSNNKSSAIKLNFNTLPKNLNICFKIYIFPNLLFNLLKLSISQIISGHT